MGKRILAIGDVHAESHDLDDCGRLVMFIQQVCRQEQVDVVLFMGDQHHHHEILHLPVFNFWRVAFKALKSDGIKTAVIVGNHDKDSKTDNHVHFMSVYERDVSWVIDKPVNLAYGVWVIPHYYSPDKFVSDCHVCAAADKVAAAEWQYHHHASGDSEDIRVPGVVFCHQTFTGSKFDNGFYAPDGIDPNLIPQQYVIAGHIHSPQRVGKVFYVGSPRWKTLSDANQSRALVLFDIEDGAVVSEKFFSTEGICKAIYHLVDTPAEPISDADIQKIHSAKDCWRIDIKGPPDFVETRKPLFIAPGVKVRTFVFRSEVAGKIRESEGINKAFTTFLGKFQSKYNTSVQVLSDMVKERLGVTLSD